MSICTPKVAQNPMVLKRQTGRFSVFYLDVTCRTLQDLSRMALANFVIFVVLNIFDNLISMQSSLNANNG